MLGYREGIVNHSTLTPVWQYLEEIYYVIANLLHLICSFPE